MYSQTKVIPEPSTESYNYPHQADIVKFVNVIEIFSPQ
jgi:hypothetical protein